MSDDIERLLADLDGEDEVEETPDVSDNRPGKGIKQLRDYAKKQEKEAAKWRKQAEELTAFKATVEQERKVSTLTGAGLNPKQAEAFLRVYGEPSPENLISFKTDILGIAPTSDEQVRSSGFEPTSGELEPSSKVVSRVDFERTMRENPAKGWELLNSGKVQF